MRHRHFAWLFAHYCSHGVVAKSAESNLAGNLAFGRAVLLTRADGLEVPHYFSAYVICGGTACAVQILSQVRGGL